MADKKSDTAKFAPPTKEIICDELVEFVAKKMACGFRKFELKRCIEEELQFEMSIKTYEVLRNKAREMLKDILLTPEQHKCNAIEMIYQVCQDPRSLGSVKLRAAELLLNTAASVPAEEGASRAEAIRKILADIDATIGEEDADSEMD